MKKQLKLFFVLIVLISSVVNSQTTSSIKGQKLALVIGNGNYASSILSNPENDARAVGEVLFDLGFEVIKYENLNQNQMKKAIDDFGKKLKGNDVGLFYYAGHGIQFRGYNYLIPVDADLQSETQIEYECVQADRILGLMETSGTSVNIIILDACRNNPFERSWTRSATGSGLAFMNAPSGTLIAYSTSPGNTASDGSGKNSPYTTAILESIQIPDITITQMFQNVGRIVTQKTEKRQTPWISSSLVGDFYFKTTSSNNTTDLQEIINDKKIDSSDPNSRIPSVQGNSLVNTPYKRDQKNINRDIEKWRYEIEGVSIGSTGTYLIKVWSYSKTPKFAIDLAKRNAVHGVIFKGFPVVESRTFQKPLADNPYLEEQEAAFFESFFEKGGKYLTFVNVSNDGSINAGDRFKVGKEYKIGVLVSVSKDNLRRYLEDCGIIKSLSNGF